MYNRICEEHQRSMGSVGNRGKTKKGVLFRKFYCYIVDFTIGNIFVCSRPDPFPFVFVKRYQWYPSSVKNRVV